MENSDSTQPMRLGVTACAGRMGRTIMAAALDAPGCDLAGASQYPGHPSIGKDAGELAGAAVSGLIVVDSAAAMLGTVDVAIDFSTPDATLAHVQAARDTGTPLVVGTTGMSPSQREEMAAAARDVAILAAPNMSIGATLVAMMTQRLAGILDTDYDIEVLGLQHRHKVDAPSGTARGLAEAAAAGRGIGDYIAAASQRDGHTGPRQAGAIGLATAQGGDMPGEHRTIFAGDGERIELAHKPANRRVYGVGAVRAAQWLVHQPSGLFGMTDVVDFAV